MVFPTHNNPIGVPRTCRTLSLILVSAIALIFLLSGVLKLFDIPGFERSLTTWRLLPAWSVFLVTVSLPNIEVGLAALWLFRLRRSDALLGMVTLVSAFIATLSLHLIFSEAPKCGCFGILEEYYSSLGDTRVAIGRNVAILAVLIAAGILNPLGRPTPAGGEA